jgi:hypothetical protein
MGAPQRTEERLGHSGAKNENTSDTIIIVIVVIVILYRKTFHDLMSRITDLTIRSKWIQLTIKSRPKDR